MFKPRENEPEYARLRADTPKDKNRYGTPIDLRARGQIRDDEPFVINGETTRRDTPNRTLQHGFYFTADNCIGCHACEAACSEKNANPPHIAFRAVGFVEGGAWPDYVRLNISMACNHCDDPVCLKGCPTRAYTKYVEYGAVLQDPDTCFGCGYCTWVCPYNAPQLDPVKGQVSKCNMCVDRLEAGLKPACVAACLGGALDFGVIESVPEGREQADIKIPGFPDPAITRPNIRFQISRSLQARLTRPDGMPLQYERRQSDHVPMPDATKLPESPQGNWKKLLTSHENAHVIFTLGTQAVMGAFALLLIFGPQARKLPGFEGGPMAFWGGLLPLMGLQALALLALVLHLGKPLRFYRGFFNLQHSPVSREIYGISLFFGGLGLFALGGLLGPMGLGWLSESRATNFFFRPGTAFAFLGGAMGLVNMIKLYWIPARPFWNHWHTAASFLGTALTLGALLTALIIVGIYPAPIFQTLLPWLAAVALVGLMGEAVGLVFHWRDMRRQGGEGAAAMAWQTTVFGWPYRVRNGLLAINMFGLAALIAVGTISGMVGLALGTLLALSLLASAVIGRALFYGAVIPTTLPGAFFWRNRAFAEHAEAVGLGGRYAMGLPPHLPFLAQLREKLTR